jgi:hypothetical protein
VIKTFKIKTMETNSFITAICYNRDDLALSVRSLGVGKSSFIIVKEDEKLVILIGPYIHPHGSIILEYLNQDAKDTVIVKGGGYCGRAGTDFEFYGTTNKFKSAHNADLQAILSVGNNTLEVNYHCLNDAPEIICSLEGMSTTIL